MIYTSIDMLRNAGGARNTWILNAAPKKCRAAGCKVFRRRTPSKVPAAPKPASDAVSWYLFSAWLHLFLGVAARKRVTTDYCTTRTRGEPISYRTPSTGASTLARSLRLNGFRRQGYSESAFWLSAAEPEG